MNIAAAYELNDALKYAKSIKSKGSINLSSYIDSFINNNSQYKQLDYQIKQAVSSLSKLDLNYLPELYFNYASDQTSYKDKTVEAKSAITNTLGVKKKFLLGLTLNAYSVNGDKESNNLEVSLPLLRNSFGAADRSEYEAGKHEVFANILKLRQQRKELLQQATLAYWNLSFAQKIFQISLTSLEKTQEIHNYNLQKRARFLNKKSDLLQSKVALDAANLTLLERFETLNQAKFDFMNLGFEQADINNKNYNLRLPNDKFVKQLKPSVIHLEKNPSFKIQIAEKTYQASVEQEKANLSKLRTKIDVFANLSEVGKDNTVQNINQQKYSKSTLGVNISGFLGDSLSDSKASLRFNKLSSKQALSYAKINEQNTLANLLREFRSLKNRLTAITELEKAQLQNLKLTRFDLKVGQATTYNLLSFEKEYLNTLIKKLNIMQNIIVDFVKIQKYDFSS